MTYAPAPTTQTLLTHAGFVRSVARALVRGDADVDDVVQATWLSVLEGGGPKDPRPVRPWLATVVRRRAADVHRDRSRRQRREERAARPEATPSASDLAERAETGRRVVEAVLALAEPHRSALLLRYYEGLPPRKVAQRLDVPVETARTRVKRGLVKLREQLDGDYGGDRRAWMSAFLPLLNGGGTAPAAAAAGASLLLKVAVALLAAAGVIVVWQASDEGFPPPLGAERPGEVHPPVLQGRATAPPPTAPRGERRTGRIHGVVRRGGAGLVCRVELHDLLLADDRSPIRWGRPDSLYGQVLGSGSPAARTQSDSEGRFAFDEVAPGNYEVRAVTETGGVATALARLLGAEPAAPLRLDVPTGPALLQGQALHADGRPFRGWIRVHALPNVSVTIAAFGVDVVDGQGLFPVDAEGRFEIRSVPPTTVRLAAVRPGVVRYVTAPVTLPRDEPFVFVVDEGMPTLTGRVLDRTSERPIAGAQVRASGMSNSGTRAHQSVATNENGRFALRLPDSALSIDARATGYVPMTRGPDPSEPTTIHSYGYYVSTGTRTLPLLRGIGGEIVLHLAKAPRVVGRVVEAESGSPVAGIPVMGIASDFPSTGAWERTTSDDDGRFVLDALPPGGVAVFAAGKGWVSEGLGFVPDAKRHNPFVRDLVAGEETKLDLRVVPAARVTGRVVDEAGAGVAGAAVRAMPHGAFPPLAVGSPQWLGTATTEDEGHFELDPVLPGFEYLFFAEAPGHAAQATERVAVGFRGRDDVVIGLGASRHVDVQVLDGARGGPVAGARIQANVKGRIVTADWWTDSEGKARVGPLPSGATTVAAQAHGFRGGNAKVESSATEVVLRLQKGSVVAGRVVGPVGVPLAGARLRLRRIEGRKRRGAGQTVVSANGRFRREGLEDGEYELGLSVEHDERTYEGTTLVRAGAEAAELRLEEVPSHARWEVSVLDPQGLPVNTATAQLRTHRPGGDSDSESGTVRTGRLVLQVREEVADARLEVYGAKDAAGLPLAAGALLDHPLSTRGGQAEVRLPAPLAIEGTVTDASGRGVEGVRLFAHAPGQAFNRWRPGLYAHATTKTGAAGAFELTNLGAATYRLSFLVPASHLPPAAIEAAAGGAPLRVRLAPAIRPRVEVRDSRGDVLAGSRLVVHPGAGPRGRAEPTEARADGDGVAHLPALAPDVPVRLVVEPPPSRDDLAHVEVTEWSPKDLSVVLARAGVVAGRIVDREGAPIVDARLVWSRGDGVWTSAKTDEEARFRLESLPLGEPIDLFARTGFDGGSEPPTRCIVRAHVGDEDLVLKARPPARVVVSVQGVGDDAQDVMLSLLPDGGRPMTTSRGGDGRFTFPQVSPEIRCVLFVVSPDEGRYAVLRDVDPGAGPFTLEMEDGLAVRGRVRLPEDAGRVHVWASRGGLSVSGRIDDGGTYVVAGLFPGTWTIHAGARVGGTYRRAEAIAEAGGTADLGIE